MIGLKFSAYFQSSNDYEWCFLVVQLFYRWLNYEQAQSWRHMYSRHNNWSLLHCTKPKPFKEKMYYDKWWNLFSLPPWQLCITCIL